MRSQGDGSWPTYAPFLRKFSFDGWRTLLRPLHGAPAPRGWASYAKLRSFEGQEDRVWGKKLEGGDLSWLHAIWCVHTGRWVNLEWTAPVLPLQPFQKALSGSLGSSRPNFLEATSALYFKEMHLLRSLAALPLIRLPEHPLEEPGQVGLFLPPLDHRLKVALHRSSDRMTVDRRLWTNNIIIIIAIGDVARGHQFSHVAGCHTGTAMPWPLRQTLHARLLAWRPGPSNSRGNGAELGSCSKPPNPPRDILTEDACLDPGLEWNFILQENPVWQMLIPANGISTTFIFL